MVEVESVSVGNDVVFDDATSGNTKTNFALGGETKTAYTVSEKKAEAYAGSIFVDFERWALSEVWKEFYVTGQDERFANIFVEGDLSGTLVAANGASSRARFKIFLFQVNGPYLVDAFTVTDKDGAFLNRDSFSEYFNEDISGYLDPGYRYRVGVRVETWSSALGVSVGVADAYRENDVVDQKIRYNKIDLNWV